MNVQRTKLSRFSKLKFAVSSRSSKPKRGKMTKWSDYANFVSTLCKKISNYIHRVYRMS